MRKLTLKGTCVAIATAAMALAGASTARAEELVMTKVHVPFAFIVGDVRMPAGVYEVRETSSDGVLEIVSENGHRVALATTIPFVPGKADQNGLVFERFGHDYFLSRIEPTGGNDREVLLTPSIMEREILKSDRAN
jgi:hypothetical protein